MERKPKERRVGMSKYETVAPHLKTVNGKRRVASLQSKATIRKDPDIDAAPLSSDSEKEAFQQPSKPYDSSEDESATHGVDIPRSGFANRGRPLRQRPAAASNARAQDSSSSPAQLHKSSEKQPSSSLPTGSFSSQHDVFQSSQGSKRKAVYGSQKGRAERIKAKTNKSEASPKGKNRNQSTEDKPDPESPDHAFKQVHLLSSQPESAEGLGFKVPSHAFEDKLSPSSTPSNKWKAPIQVSPLKEEGKDFYVPKLPTRNDESDSELPDIGDIRSPTKRNKKRSFEDMTQLLSEHELQTMIKEARCEPSHPISPSREALGSLDLDEDADQLCQSHAICPMCGDHVDIGFLQSYSGGERMNIKKQDNFCQAHKIRSAREEWTTRGYPTIDWTTLDQRIQSHHSFLKQILDGHQSYYRNVLQDAVKTGKGRTLRQDIFGLGHTLTPGYYGPRGLRAMSENIMTRFSPQLRRIAVKDRLVSARGVTGYVQAVLVPELAVRLIGEDLGIGVEETRRVMDDSVALGDLLNDELDEVVVMRDEHYEDGSTFDHDSFL